MVNLSGLRNVCAVFLLSAGAAISLPAQTFTTLFTFNNTDGANPTTLVQGLDRTFYGTTSRGGSSKCADNGCGTVFKVTSEGRFFTLHFFQGPDGAVPMAGLLLATNGNFYGTTYNGGDLKCEAPDGCGTIFEITPQGKLTTLHTFEGTDGESPVGGLIQATDGSFYGTTLAGGNSACIGGCGTVFRITPRGALTTLHYFDGSDGQGPSARLLQASNGNFYGTTLNGGDLTCDPHYGCGTIFEVSPRGSLRKLYSFCPHPNNCTDGAYPGGGLVQAANGNFYGTTIGQAFTQYGFGTVYEITTAGALTTLHSFCDGANCPDGFSPFAEVTQATDGNFYGTTAGGGDPYGYGVVFEISPEGALITLHTFDGADGANASGALIQSTDGNFYGTTFTSSPTTTTYCGCGTVFRLSVGLGPFVETLPASGNVGRAVRILGTDLKGATSVTFHGVTAAFKIASPTEIVTTVPTGATTGTVEVVTVKGTLKSNIAFNVP